MVLVDAAHPGQVARSPALMTPEEAKRDHNGLMQNREGLDIDRILEEVRATRWHADIPLVVLAHGRTESSAREEKDWRDMQMDHARRSPSGTLIVAEDSAHNIQIDQPALVVDAIRRVVDIARARRGAGRQ
jgi:pimeloyl-ACP methyl ester carboxylesterase